jgi:hypothetical protein
LPGTKNNYQADGNSEQTVADSATFEWRPSTIVTIMWTVLGGLLVILGIFLFGLFYVLLARPEPPESFTLDLIVLILLAAAVMLLHEAFHGLAALYYGGRPTFGAAVLHKIVPVLYCTVEGHRFSRGQFAVFALAPIVGISVLGMVAMLLTPWGLWIIFPLAINFGGAIGDLWMTWLVLREPPGTQVEDLKDGIRFHYSQVA